MSAAATADWPHRTVAEDDFVIPEGADTKSPQRILAPIPPLAFVRSG